jgi:diacylglycerol kinase
MSDLNRWQSFRCALAGVAYVLRTQRNAHIELAAAVLTIAAGMWLRVTYLEWTLLALTIGLVFVAEMMNTAVEHAVDVATREQDPLARVAKDAAAGSVLTAIIVAFVTGLLVFGPRLWALIGR